MKKVLLCFISLFIVLIGILTVLIIRNNNDISYTIEQIDNNNQLYKDNANLINDLKSELEYTKENNTELVKEYDVWVRQNQILEDILH